jgi:type I restriction enzyme S subunit
MTDHPRHWLTATLGEMGEIRLGRMLDRAKNRGELRRYLRNINVRWFGFDLSGLSSMGVPQEESEQLSVRDGDLFVCEGGEPGRCAVWRLGENDLVYQKALHRVRPEQGMVPEFLMYQLRHHADTGALSEAFTGTTIKHLTRQSLAGYEIGIAPTHEQKRIADKLDAVLARVDACRERLERVPDILKRFRQAVLAAAISGKLTEDW